MKRTYVETARVRVDAPDAATALRLERRIAHLAPTAVSVGAKWWVEIPDVGVDALPELVAAVEDWLAEEELPETELHQDGTTRTIAAEAPR
jgi:hypothetical protein